MSRYVATPPAASLADKDISVTADTVVEPEDCRVNTGLVNADGYPIYRLREPIGFDPKRWR